MPTTEETKTIQNFLKEEGSFSYPTATGYYGPITKEAVKQFQIKQGLTATGLDFLLSFDDVTVAKILGDLELLDELGYLLRPPKSKKIAKDLYELRVFGDISIRIFYTFYKNEILILHAFIKKSQKIPKQELGKVINMLKYLH